jgi:large subunit ribosomal protein L6
MSRIANMPVVIPSGVEVSIETSRFSVKGPKGNLGIPLDGSVTVSKNDNNQLLFRKNDEGRHAQAMVGTVRALANNMVRGVSNGFERRLMLSGVGYRVSMQGKKLNLSLGFSHPVLYELPESIQAEVPSQTEIVLRGCDKALLGQTAATIRAFRPPEPYKGKGVHFQGEYVHRKEAKKKK